MIKWYIVMYKLSGYTYPIFNDNKITLHPNQKQWNNCLICPFCELELSLKDFLFFICICYKLQIRCGQWYFQSLKRTKIALIPLFVGDITV